jgi:hypothetical protein
LRRRRSSSRSDSLTAPGAELCSAASRSAFTQFHKVPSAISSDRATSATGRPDDFTRARASRRNSGGYFAGRPTRASFLQGLPQNQVSTRTGQLHRGPRADHRLLRPLPPNPAPPRSGCLQLQRPAATDHRWVLSPHPVVWRLVAHREVRGVLPRYELPSDADDRGQAFQSVPTRRRLAPRRGEEVGRCSCRSSRDGPRTGRR